MSIQLSGKHNIEVVQQMAKFVRKLTSQRFLRESILVRMCLAGHKISELVNRRVGYFGTLHPEPVPSPKIHEVGYEFDIFCIEEGTTVLATVVTKYLDQFRKRSKHDLKHAAPNSLPAFPGKECKKPITQRHVARALAIASKRIKWPEPPTYRFLQSIGRRLKSWNPQRDTKNDEYTNDAIEGFRWQINWLLSKLFPFDSHAREDAWQTAVLELLQTQSGGKITMRSDFARMVLKSSIRRYYDQYRRNRENCRTDAIPDWLTLTNGTEESATRAEFIERVNNINDSWMALDPSFVKDEIRIRIRRLKDSDQREVIRLRFGLNNAPALSDVIIARKMGKPIGQIRAILAETMQMLEIKIRKLNSDLSLS